MIKFSALIKLAPFPDDMKNYLIEKENELTEDQKFELSETAWQALSMIYKSKLQELTDEMLFDMSQGKKNYSKNDFQEAEARLIYEFSHKLDAVKTEADISEVREKLESIKSLTVSPPPQP